MALTALAFDLVSKRISTVAVDATSAAVRVDLLSDRMYAAVGTTVVPMFAGTRVTGTSRTGKLVDPAFPRMGWLRLDGPFTSAVVRIYRDGILFHTTPAIIGPDPVRLPPGLSRIVEIEVESSGRVTALVMASSTEELQRVS